MAPREFQRKLVVTADTQSLSKGAQAVREFGKSADGASAMLKRMKADMDPSGYQSFASSLKPAIEAEREMARMARAVTAELKPFAAQMREAQTEALKQAEAINRLALSETRRAEALRRTFEGGYANAQKYAKIEVDVARQIELRNLTAEQGNAILTGAAKRYDQMGKHAQAANQNVKLTSGQMQGLGYQANDVATMLLMGASPFQIMASQAGQVVQVLGDGPKGMKGSLSAIGSSIASFARSIPVAGYAVAAVTAAVGALWYATSGPKARSAEESIKSFENAVKRLEDGWKGAGAAAEEHFARAQRAASGNKSAVLLDTQAELKRLRDDYQNAVRDLNTADGLPEQILRARSGGLSPAHQQIRDLYADLRQGEITAADFAAEMLKIRLDPNADDYARVFADAIRQGVGHATELEQRINAIAAAASKLGGRGGRVTGADEANPFDLRDRFGGVTGIAGRLDPAGMDSVRDQLRDQRSEFEGYLRSAEQAQQALANFDLSPVKRQIAETTQEYDRQIAALNGTAQASIAIAALQTEKEAALGLIRKQAAKDEEARRASMALDLPSVSAVSTQEKEPNR